MLIHGAHVDVPAFLLGRLDTGQIAHGGLGALHVSRGGADDEFALEGIDSDFRVRNRPIAICQPVDVVAEQFAAAIVGVDVRLEPHFGIHIDDGLGIDRRRGTLTAHNAARLCRHDIHVAHLPTLGACTGAAVRRASHFR